MEQVIKKERNKKNKIILTSENDEKLNLLLEPFKKWQEVVSVTKSDLVNFIISTYNETLSPSEIKTLLKAMVNRNEKPKERKARQKKASLKENNSSTSVI